MPSQISIQTDDGAFDAYIARPDQPMAPAVVVLHEAFGVNADMRQTCNELAAQGFVALCPDLYWRLEPGVDLNVTTDADWQKAQKLYAAFDRDTAVHDIAATVRAASALEGTTGKVGLLGFCLGGLMTFLTAARERIDAAVAYHGAETDKYLDEACRISAPMLMHLAEEDEFIPKAAQAQIKATLAGRPNVEIYSYPGCAHAFARHGGLHYDADAAALANGRSWQFLRDHLRSSAV
ncbi:dienelactone hydrolase family protein [Sphingomonas sp. JC676]|uniref:dienelactone hydrolase family protein n=1 Tax=Sphingomonas sp. JC676 TaxID=2768065 RepID=UPI0016578113|nr:dienelactone hydrolase family protein [Sphingomonas sp. JC676]MBC9032897.1 dienelactone hydrolase family protein [Sphingomonas sp. JC676]